LGWDFERVGQPPLHSEHWEPLLRTIEAISWPVSFHTGFNSGFNDTDNLDLSESFRELDGLQQAKLASLFFTGNVHCLGELIMGRICHRYPTLKFVSVESGVGWMPYLTEALDWQFLSNNVHHEFPEMLLPSDYFRRQIYGTFFFESHIPRFVDLFPDNFMFETDFPHGRGSLTPHDAHEAVKGPHETIVANLGHLEEEILVKLLHGNAAKVYGLP
jgi:predicted TIM-barrel fold metal-dependent hydrolase